MAAPARIEVVAGPGTGKQLELAVGESAVIGRGDRVALSIPDRTVSKEHVALEHTPSGVLVRDLGSRHRATVDGRVVPSEGVLVVETSIVALGKFSKLRIARPDLPKRRVVRARLPKAPPGIRYEEVLGEGSEGVVYAAWQDPPGRRVAVKAIVMGDGDLEVIERARREAALQGRLDHPAIVRVHELVEVGGKLFLVREIVSGDSLDHVLGRGRLPWRRAVEIAATVTEALAHAHARGVIHRDVNPGNIFIEDSTGAVRLTDFGLARDVSRSTADGTRLTRTASGLGTWHYSAPETAFEAKTAGPRADVYAVAAVLYHALSGRKPFGDVSFDDYARAVYRGPTPLEEIAPVLPASVRASVSRGLAPAPEDRPDAALYARELRNLRP